MEPLLGIVLVAHLPSQQAEVYFQYPPSEDVEAVKNHPASGGSKTETVGEEKEPQVSLSGSHGAIWSGIRPVASGEDLCAGISDCFGIPSNIFAKLMLPESELCNRPFFFEMDAGHRVTSHPHDSLSHLLFASFPCKVDEFHTPEGTTKTDSPAGFQNVQTFNVVHILDSRLTSYQDDQTNTLWEVSAHLARALVTEEARVRYLSQEIKKMETAKHEFKSLEEVLRESSLARLLREMYLGVKKIGYKALWVNECILCEVCVFPKHQAPAPPSPEQALALLCNREELLTELPFDAAEIVVLIIQEASPRKTLREVMLNLALPHSTLQKVAQHLVFWRKARVVEVFRNDTRVTVDPTVDISPDSQLSRRFHAWWAKRPIGHGQDLTLSELMHAFSQGQSLQQIKETISQAAVGIEFDRILEWLIAENVLVQLATYCRFHSSQAYLCPDISVNAKYRKLERHYCPKYLTEYELRLLASRAGAEDRNLLFLCRFVVELVREHVRIDGSRFEALAAEILLPQDIDAGLPRRLLDVNNDVFVKYVCRC